MINGEVIGISDQGESHPSDLSIDKVIPLPESKGYAYDCLVSPDRSILRKKIGRGKGVTFCNEMVAKVKNPDGSLSEVRLKCGNSL